MLKIVACVTPTVQDIMWAWEKAGQLFSLAELEISQNVMKVQRVGSIPEYVRVGSDSATKRTRKRVSGDFFKARLWICLKRDMKSCRISGGGFNCHLESQWTPGQRFQRQTAWAGTGVALSLLPAEQSRWQVSPRLMCFPDIYKKNTGPTEPLLLLQAFHR